MTKVFAAVVGQRVGPMPRRSGWPPESMGAPLGLGAAPETGRPDLACPVDPPAEKPSSTAGMRLVAVDVVSDVASQVRELWLWLVWRPHAGKPKSKRTTTGHRGRR